MEDEREPMLMMIPLFLWIIWGRTICVIRAMDMMLQLTMSWIAFSSAMSAKGSMGPDVIPTLLIKIPISNLDSSVRNLLYIESPSVKSTEMVFTWIELEIFSNKFQSGFVTDTWTLFHKELLISSATLRSFSGVLLTSTTLRPEAAIYKFKL